jgi:DNA ligase (NAD+)
LAGVEKSKEVPFEKVLFALGIRFVGETVAKKLARHYKSIDALQNATFEELVEVDEIGEKIAESIRNYFDDLSNIMEIDRLKSAGLKFSLSEEQLANTTDKLTGLSFVISGVFQNHSRDELKKLIEDNGGKNVGSLSKKTSYLIRGENMGPSKLAKAEGLGIPMISEDEFVQMLT